jgi:hypothetical protein
MGVKIFAIGDGRETIELTCDSPSHVGDARTAWFDSGSGSGNLALAIAAGWMERRNAKRAWLCPQCVERNTKKRGTSKNMRTNIVPAVGKAASPRAALSSQPDRAR